MSKKFFLQKSYADAVRGSHVSEENALESDGFPGESVLKPKYMCFSYTNLSSSGSSEDLPVLVKSKKSLKRKGKKHGSPSKKICFRDEIIEISDSSPEKSPRKTACSPLKTARRRLTHPDTEESHNDVHILSSSSDNEKSPEKPVSSISIASAKRKHTSVDSDSNSLPDIDERSEVPLSGSVEDFYQSDPLMPIYKRLSKGIETKEVNKVLLQHWDENSIAKNIPSQINENVSFLYSVKFIGHWKNTLCDGMGSWKQMGKQVSLINISEIDFEISHDVKEVLKENVVLKSIRHKYVNNTSPDLHRVILHMETEDGTVLDLVFAKYYFENEPHSFIPNPHKNSKQLEKYQRTSESTKMRIQTLVDENKRPNDIFHTIIEEQGGIEHTPGGLFLPRDRQQIKNISKMKKSSTSNFDSLAELMDFAKSQEQMKDVFVREVRCAPEFTVFLASNCQLKEMEKYCTNAKNFSILGIDTTFNIGAFYVTVTTYRNTVLMSKNGNEPVMIGPILIHQKKNFDSYFKLSSSILQICPEMKNLKAFGTDGDKNLSDAFEVCFTSTKHLLCDIHMQDNIERKLKDLGITKSKAREYIDDIFGKRTGEVKIKGLVDCMSSEEFDHKLQNLYEKWKSLHQNGNLFLKYFVEFKADLIKNCMSAELRSLSGLGFPPKPYNQNANECMNSVIKSDLKKDGHHSKINEKEVVLALEKTVKRQEAEVKLSLIGKGEYRLKKEYQHLQVPDNIYWRKTPLQREAVFTKMLKEPLLALGEDFTCHTGELEDLQENSSLPISAENSQITNIPFQILKNIFEEAQTIINSVNGIVEMPGYKDRSSLFILNVAHLKDPYKICKLKTTSFFTCENRCHRFSSFKLCSHTIAAANYCDILKDFIKIYNEKYKSLGTSLTKMALANMPKSRGQKPKGTSVRKGQNNKCSTEIIEFETPHTPSLDQPFHLTFLAGIVKKCYGCGQCFSDRQRSPPNDLILKRFDHRKYLSPNSKTYKTTPTLQNTYLFII